MESQLLKRETSGIRLRFTLQLKGICSLGLVQLSFFLLLYFNRGFEEIMLVLLDYDATDVNVKDKNGWTALHLSCNAGTIQSNRPIQKMKE